jgi:hypothetical protein
MPRELKQLPRWGYSDRLDTLTLKGNRPKKHQKIWNENKQGLAPRQRGNLDYKYVGRRPTPPVWRPDYGRKKGDIIRYDVSCTICLDQGCDRCPAVAETAEGEDE